MLACVDVDYRDGYAVAGSVVFRDWADAEPVSERTAIFRNVAPYVPGEFFRRELPCLLEVLRGVTTPLNGIIIDGYVWLDERQTPGLGAHLFDAIEDAAPRPFVIGVAKTRYGSGRAEEVLRGRSASALYVTAVGIDPRAAASNVRGMHGKHRLPTMIKRVDRLCRDAVVIR